MGKALGDARKIVVSNQNLQFTWRNAEQLQNDLVEAVTALKNEPGATDIAMSGSVSIVRQLLAACLLDELHLLVHPIAVRNGMRLFDEGESPIPLRLTSSQTFTTGVLHLIYARRIGSHRHVRGRKRICPNLRTADIPPLRLGERPHCQTWPRSGARERASRDTAARRHQQCTVIGM